MYAMAKICTSNNILTKTRRGFTQKSDSLDRNNKETSNDTKTRNHVQPKPVFHLSPTKCKEETQVSSPSIAQASITPQHEEIIKYLHESWNNVIQEYQSDNEKKPEPKIAYFDCKPSTPLPKFEPFDLESFWSQRFYQQIISS